MQIDWNKFTPRSAQRTPKLTLEKDESARICVLDGAPTQTFVHQFRTLKVDPATGKVEEEKGAWPDGKEFVRPKTEYAGKFRCLGDPEVLDISGADPDKCPACKAHVENPNAVQAATPRFIVKVLKYATKNGSTTPVKPFSASLIVWDLTEKRFAEIYALYQEHGNLREKDLILGPCENKAFQKYNINIAGGAHAYYMDHMEAVEEIIKENPIDDPEAVAAKLPSFSELQIKVNEIVRSYNHAMGTGVGSSNYTALLDDSDSDETPKAAPKVSSESKERSLNLDLDSLGSDDEDADEDSESSDEESNDVTAGLDDLLNLLKN